MSWLLCVALGVVTATYSSWGGIKAVVTTDAIQSLTVTAGADLMQAPFPTFAST